MTPDILQDDKNWSELDLTTLSEMAVDAVLKHQRLDPEIVEVSILATSDLRIAELNSDFREKPLPTNVLSWPSEDLGAEAAGGTPLPPQPDPDGTLPLGDIAIAFETCAREAEEMGKPLAEHVTHLIVHGVLHLLGYDHIRDPDATLMQGIEAEILGKLGYNDPYND